jgi:hypothetical protein
MWLLSYRGISIFRGNSKEIGITMVFGAVQMAMIHITRNKFNIVRINLLCDQRQDGMTMSRFKIE